MNVYEGSFLQVLGTEHSLLDHCVYFSSMMSVLLEIIYLHQMIIILLFVI